MKFRKPMLAKNYEGNEHRVAFPCYVQPKLDGIRCITDGKRFWSRNGKLLPIINLKHLQVSGLSCLVDGELMVEDSAHFEEVVSAVKNGTTLDRSLAARVRFHVFDVMIDEPYRRRRLIAEINIEYAKRHGAAWKMVTTFVAMTPVTLQTLQKDFLRAGYEGTIIRSAVGKYVAKRTLDLLKWKPLMDDEFPILRIKEAKGKDQGTPVFICMSEGGQFAARPMGTMAQRRKMWRERKQLIGKMLTVEFQNYTRHNKPRFPRAKVLRDYE